MLSGLLPCGFDAKTISKNIIVAFSCDGHWHSFMVETSTHLQWGFGKEWSNCGCRLRLTSY